MERVLLGASAVAFALVRSNSAAAEDVNYTYYPDTGYVRSETRESPEQWANIYKYYFNEPDQWGAGHGRELMEMRDSLDSDGASAYHYEYEGDTYTRLTIKKYHHIDYSDPRPSRINWLYQSLHLFR